MKNVLNCWLKGWSTLVVFWRMPIIGWIAVSLPPEGLETQEVSAGLGAGAAATKLAEAKRKAGMKERTRIANEL